MHVKWRKQHFRVGTSLCHWRGGAKIAMSTPPVGVFHVEQISGASSKARRPRLPDRLQSNIPDKQARDILPCLSPPRMEGHRAGKVR